MFESVQKTFHRVLRGDPEEIETKLEKIKKDDLRSIVKKIKKTINVS